MQSVKCPLQSERRAYFYSTSKLQWGVSKVCLPQCQLDICICKTSSGLNVGFFLYNHHCQILSCQTWPPIFQRLDLSAFVPNSCCSHLCNTYYFIGLGKIIWSNYQLALYVYYLLVRWIYASATRPGSIFPRLNFREAFGPAAYLSSLRLGNAAPWDASDVPKMLHISALYLHICVFVYLYLCVFGQCCLRCAQDASYQSFAHFFDQEFCVYFCVLKKEVVRRGSLEIRESNGVRGFRCR